MNRTIKENIKSIVPSFVLKTYHSFRAQLFALKRKRLAGNGKKGERLCNYCGNQSKAFTPTGLNVPIIRELNIKSAGTRSQAICPHCLSKDRERTLLFFLERMTGFFEDNNKKVLHMAPEALLSKTIKEFLPENDYYDADLNPEHATHKVDVTAIPFKDKTFDVVICNHVLEHIPDDLLAMGELRRVLKDDGFAILQVPISFTIAQTIEDFSITDPSGREAAFGQVDHVRVYGRDYVTRLSRSGWNVRMYFALDFLSLEEIERYSLIEDEPVFYCEKENL